MSSESSDDSNIFEYFIKEAQNTPRRRRPRSRRKSRETKNQKHKQSSTSLSKISSLLDVHGQVDEREIENLLSKSPKEILDCLLDSHSGFKQILQLEYLQDTIVCILAAINKAFEAKRYRQAVDELRKILIDSDLFSKHLTELLNRNKPNLSIILNKIGVMDVISNVLPILQRSSKSSIQSFVLFFYFIRKTVLENNIEFASEALKTFEERLDNELIKIDERKNNEHVTNKQIEFNNFRNIPIIPNADELFSSNEPFLSSIIERGSYQTLDYYLAVQFRLLREDFVASLRSAFQEYQKRVTEQHQNKYGEANFYENVQIKLTFVRGEEYFKITFKNLPKQHSETTDRLKYGNLLCISSNKFKTVYFGLIQTYEEDELPYNETLIQVTNKKMKKSLEEEVLNKSSFVIMESPAYFEAYRHVLSCLQRIKQNQLPFEKHIVRAEPQVKAPIYLKSNATYKIPICNNQKKDVLICDLNAWPTNDDLHLDKSQVKALHLALSVSLAIIQGPPGTGKTFIGLKILRTLLDNQQIWNRQRSPILIVCYTNHALDQFLEAILQFNHNLVRVGGRSMSSELEEYNLKYLKENDPHCMKLISEINEMKMKIENLEHLVKNKNKYIFHECMLDLPKPENRLLNQLKDKSENFESKSSLASWLAVTFTKVEIVKLTSSLSRLSNRLKEVSIKTLDNCKGTEINSLAMMFCHLNFPDDMKRILLQKLRQPCALKKNIAIEELKKEDDMDEQEVMTVDDIWTLSQENRWRLYRRWLRKLTEKAKDELPSLQKAVDLKRDSLKTISKKATFDILRSSEIIGMTTSGAARYYNILNRLSCKIVIVEEAAEVLESHIITSLNPKTEHLILIGDHQQLKPKPAEYRLAKEYHLDLSLFERLINNNLPFVTLEQQHRMRPEISSIIQKHFYPNIRDDLRVLDYPDIRGVNSNVYFISHTNFEEIVTEDSPTYKNEFEANFLLSFCEYLIQQGYDENCITILTTYNGQLTNLNFLRKKYKTLSQKLRISTVDNYQGEENDIILLSLVRSNYDGIIGFLKEPNRVNVALTRAKHGLFVIGNFQLFAQESELWRGIVFDLIENKQFGMALPIVCPNHENNVRKIKKSEDFKALAPGGRCNKLCEFKLVCSHKCSLNCGHEGNHNCLMNDTRSLSCGHKITATCSGLELVTANIQTFCKQKCGKFLDCGHQCQLICHNDNNHNCKETKKQILSCGRHEKNYLCSMTSIPFKETKFICDEECNMRMACYHQCSLKCHSHYHHECNKIIRRVLSCGHESIVKCTGLANYSSSVVTNPNLCSKKCEQRMVCGHLCALNCHVFINRSLIKHDCKVEVMKQLSCNHRIKLPCKTDPNSYSCPEIVTRYLTCGKHTLVTKCGEDLRNVSCNACSKKNSKCIIS